MSGNEFGAFPPKAPLLLGGRVGVCIKEEGLALESGQSFLPAPAHERHSNCVKSWEASRLLSQPWWQWRWELQMWVRAALLNELEMIAFLSIVTSSSNFSTPTQITSLLFNINPNMTMRSRDLPKAVMGKWVSEIMTTAYERGSLTRASFLVRSLNSVCWNFGSIGSGPLGNWDCCHTFLILSLTN